MSYADAERAYAEAVKVKKDAKKALIAAKRQAAKNDVDAKKALFRERYIHDYHETFGPQLELERQEKELIKQLLSLQLRKASVRDEQKDKWQRIQKWYEEESARNRWRTEFLKNREKWIA